MTYADPPFALPALATVTLDLPFPISTNRLWRASHAPGKKLRVRLSDEYKSWKDDADMAVIGTPEWRKRPKNPIAGHFEAHIQLNGDLGRRLDADNSIKCLLDWAQSRSLVVNDKNCRRFIVEWVDHANAPRGARLTLREMAK